MQKNIALSVIVSGVIIAGAIFLFSDKSEPVANTVETTAQNVTIKDGVQYVTINAQNGYSPRSTVIAPDMPTKLVVKTNGTYGCTTSLSIKAIGYQKVLEPTGEEVIDLGSPKSGFAMQGLCGMGMYNFEVKAS